LNARVGDFLSRKSIKKKTGEEEREKEKGNKGTSTEKTVAREKKKPKKGDRNSHSRPQRCLKECGKGRRGRGQGNKNEKGAGKNSYKTRGYITHG